MADTTVQLQIEDWVRREWMPLNLKEEFTRDDVVLNTGGIYSFDAVNSTKSVIATISTSGSRTAGGKHAVGKMLKIRSDVLFLLMAENAKRRVVILTEEDMYELCCRDKKRGRLPTEIEFFWAQLPPEHKAKLKQARAKASKEVTPLQMSV